MNPAIYAAAVTASVAGLALLLHPFALGRYFWPPSPLCPLPSDAQFPFYAFVALVEASALGLAVSWLAWVYPAVRFFRARWQRLVMFGGVAWLLGNWYPHDALHINVGPDLQSMIAIELGFHVTLIATAAAMAVALAVQARN